MESIALFHTFINAYRQIGPFELHPVKTRVALLTNMRFCTVNKIGWDYTDVHFSWCNHLMIPSIFIRLISG